MLLVTGGSGCGKSAYAEKRIQEYAEKNKNVIYYLATMQVYGEEGRKKVDRHIELRRGKGMLTIEQTRDIAECIPKLPEENACLILEDLGNLVANEMFREDAPPFDWQTVSDKIIADVRELRRRVSYLVLVTNNVFEDGIAYEEGTENYIKALGSVNARIARDGAEVVEVVAGIPCVVRTGDAIRAAR